MTTFAAGLVALGSFGSAAAARKGGSGGGVVTFAEQPGVPPNYIFPIFSGAYTSNANMADLAPLMWPFLYTVGHPTSTAITVDDKLSMADPPVFSNGGKTVTVKLKHYLWSTGAPVTARDLVFFLNLVLNNKTDDGYYVPGGWMTHVASYKAVSASTFVLSFTEPYNQTYLQYNVLAGFIALPQQAWDKTSASTPVGTYDTTAKGAKAVYSFLNAQSKSLSTWDTNPLWQVVDGAWHLKPGTGFQVTGQTIFVPNKKYSGPNRPKIGEFELLPFTSSAAEYDALRAGSVDYGYVPNTDLGSIGSLKASGFRVQPWYEWAITFIMINFSNPKYAAVEDQLYIRQAMQMLVNQPEYVKTILKGYAYPTYGPVPPEPRTQFMSPAEAKSPYPYSPSTAKKLLESHGWDIHVNGTDVCTRPGAGSGECGAGISSGTKLSLPLLYASGFPNIADEIQAMRSEFSEAGIHLTLSEAPSASVLADAYACTGAAAVHCPASSTALSITSTPDFNFEEVFDPIGTNLWACGGSINAGNYCNKQVDQLITGAEHGGSAASLKSLYEEQELLAKQLPGIWVPSAPYQISAISTKLRGISAQNPTTYIYPETWALQS